MFYNTFFVKKINKFFLILIFCFYMVFKEVLSDPFISFKALDAINNFLRMNIYLFTFYYLKLIIYIF